MRLRSLIAATFLGVSTSLTVPSATAAAAVVAVPHCAGYSVFERDFDGQTSHTSVPTVHHQNFDIDCVLAPGDRGAGVAALQATLNRCYAPIAIDGMFGQKMARLVRDLQVLLGIPVDGIYGPHMARAMNWAWYDASGTSQRCDRL